MQSIVGLGNPGEKYAKTRHNTGRMVLESLRTKHGLPAWTFDRKLNAEISEGKLGKTKVLLVCPDTFMNNSGKTVTKLVSSKKAALGMLVVYDDLDLPLGTLKVSFGKSSGGHNGLESILRALKTKDFPRVRIGVSPATPGGKIRKPQSEKKVLEFLLGEFSKKEMETFTKVIKKVLEAIEVSAEEGYVKAMNVCN